MGRLQAFGDQTIDALDQLLRDVLSLLPDILVNLENPSQNLIDLQANILSEEIIKQSLSGIFNKYDTNNNSVIEFTEFSSAWHSMGLGGPEADIRAAFDHIDAD